MDLHWWRQSDTVLSLTNNFLAFDLIFTHINCLSLNYCNPCVMHIFIASRGLLHWWFWLTIKDKLWQMKNRNSMTCVRYQISVLWKSCKPLHEQHITFPYWFYCFWITWNCSICYKKAVAIIQCLLIYIVSCYAAGQVTACPDLPHSGIKIYLDLTEYHWMHSIYQLSITCLLLIYPDHDPGFFSRPRKSLFTVQLCVRAYLTLMGLVFI